MNMMMGCDLRSGCRHTITNLLADWTVRKWPQNHVTQNILSTIFRLEANKIDQDQSPLTHTQMILQATREVMISRQPFWIMPLFSASAVFHYNDVIMSTIASQITSLTILYSTVYSGADQRKHQSSASLAFVRGIYRGPVNFPHKGLVTRKMFPFDDVIMRNQYRKVWRTDSSVFSAVSVCGPTTLGSKVSAATMMTKLGFCLRATLEGL